MHVNGRTMKGLVAATMAQRHACRHAAFLRCNDDISTPLPPFCIHVVVGTSSHPKCSTEMRRQSGGITRHAMRGSRPHLHLFRRRATSGRENIPIHKSLLSPPDPRRTTLDLVRFWGCRIGLEADGITSNLGLYALMREVSGNQNEDLGEIRRRLEGGARREV